MLSGLKLAMECCRPNVLGLLLGVAFVNKRLSIFHGDQDVLAYYSFSIDHEEPLAILQGFLDGPEPSNRD